MTPSLIPSLQEVRKSISSAAKIPFCSPEDLLDAAFSKTTSSHDVVFVQGASKEFLGIVSPSPILYRRKHLFHTKVRSCLMNPPHITLATPLPVIAESMATTGVYTLPVFGSKGTIIGVVTARDILREAFRIQGLSSQLTSSLKANPPVTTQDSSTVQEVHALMRKHASSRVVITKDGKVAGIVARRDIQFPFLKPTTRQRIRTGGTGTTRDYLFGLEKRSRLDTPVQPFIQRNVLSLNNTVPLDEVARHLLLSSRSSVVLTSPSGIPTGIVSMRLLLQALSAIRPAQEYPISITNRTSLPRERMELVQQSAENLAKKLSRKVRVRTIEVRIAQSRARKQSPEFEVSVEVQCYGQSPLFAKTTHPILKNAAHMAIQCIESELRKI